LKSKKEVKKLKTKKKKFFLKRKKKNKKIIKKKTIYLPTLVRKEGRKGKQSIHSNPTPPPQSSCQH
jgi:hypothetical protein